MAGRFSLRVHEAAFTIERDGKSSSLHMRDVEVSGAVTPDGLSLLGSVAAEFINPQLAPLPSPSPARAQRRRLCHCCNENVPRRKKCNGCHFLVCIPCITVTAVDHGGPLCKDCDRR